MTVLLQNNTLSNLKLNNLYFDKIIYISDGNNNELDAESNISFECNNFIATNNDIRINLICNVSKNGTNIIVVSLIGCFSLSSNDDIKKYIPNAVAIMFPYLRSQISLITTQPNCSVIVLPALNINALLKENLKSDSGSVN